MRCKEKVGTFAKKVRTFDKKTVKYCEKVGHFFVLSAPPLLPWWRFALNHRYSLERRKTKVLHLNLINLSSV